MVKQKMRKKGNYDDSLFEQDQRPHQTIPQIFRFHSVEIYVPLIQLIGTRAAGLTPVGQVPDATM